MFNFAGITHIVDNPSGHAPGYNFRFVGSVPVTCLEPRKPTTSDIMGGRVQKDGFAYVGRRLETIEQALKVAWEGGAKLCTSKDCTCRQWFDAEVKPNAL